MGDLLSVTIAWLSRWITSRRDSGRGPFNGGKCAEQVQCAIYVCVGTWRRRRCFVRTQCGGPGETVRCSGPMHGCLSAGMTSVTQDSAERPAVHHGAICQCEQWRPYRHRKCSARPCRWLGEATQYERKLKRLISWLPNVCALKRQTMMRNVNELRILLRPLPYRLVLRRIIRICFSTPSRHITPYPFMKPFGRAAYLPLPLPGASTVAQRVNLIQLQSVGVRTT
jgi:hypothetical protein